MRRLSPAAAAAAHQWCQTSATPYCFAALAAEPPRDFLMTASRCDELALRMTHQLERLRAAFQATMAKSYGSRGPARALDVLLALHMDTVQQLHNYRPVIERLRERGLRENVDFTNASLEGSDTYAPPAPEPLSKYRQDEGETLRTLIAEFEGRHAVASETVMEVLTAGVLPPEQTASFLATRISTQLLLRHHLDLWPARAKPTQGAATAPDASVSPVTSSAVQASVGLAQVAKSAAAEARLLVEAALHVSPEVFVNVVNVVPTEHTLGAYAGAASAPIATGDVHCEATAAAAAAAASASVLWKAAAAAPATSGAAKSGNSKATDDVFVCTSPSYVRYVLLELLKNALRAAAEHPAAEKPPVRVLVGVHAQKAWVVVRNSRERCDDQSTDLLNASLSKALARFGERELASSGRPVETSDDPSTSPPTPAAPALWDRLTEQGSYMPTRAPLHGIGVGLGLSRAHATYLGGALTVRAFGEGAMSDSANIDNQQEPGVEALFELPLGSSTAEGIPERPLIAKLNILSF